MSQPPRRRPGSDAPAERSSIGAWFAAHRPGGLAIAVLAASVAGGWAVWSRYGDDARAQRDSVLLPEAVLVRGVADWVKGDVRTEALRNASLDRGLPLDDPELQRRLARAFDMHPWIRRVVAVELLHPAAAVVEVECREPAAMVAWQGGLLAVDAEAVVLPSADFTPEAAAVYPRVAGIESSPQGTEGFPWGDAAVEEAAALASALGPDWTALGLLEMRPVRDRNARMWELAAADGSRILFGSAPGRELAGEPPAAAKLARLKELGASGGDGRLDLTVDSGREPAPRAIPAG